MRTSVRKLLLGRVPILSDPHLVLALNMGRYNAATDSVPNLGSGGSALDARYGSTIGADVNDPHRLVREATPYVYLPGVPGNHIISTETAGGSFTTIEWAVRVRMPTFAGIARHLGGRNGGIGRLFLTATGNLRIRYTDGSSNPIGFASSDVIPDSSGWVWLRGRLTPLTALCEYWYSTTDTDDYASVSWTSAGSLIGSNPAAPISSSHASIVGALSDGAADAAGDFRRFVEVVDSVVSKDWSAVNAVEPFASQVSPVTGTTWNYARTTTGRKLTVVRESGLLCGIDDRLVVPNHALLNFGATESFTLISVGRCHAANPINTRMVSKWVSPVGYVLYSGGGAQASTAFSQKDGGTALTHGAALTYGKMQVRALRHDRVAQLQSVIVDGVPATTSIAGVASTANAFDLTIGSDPGGGGYRDEFVGAVLLVRRALTDAETVAYGQAVLNA